MIRADVCIPLLLQAKNKKMKSKIRDCSECGIMLLEDEVYSSSQSIENNYIFREYCYECYDKFAKVYE